MIEDKNELIEEAKYLLKRNEEIIKDNSDLFDECEDLYQAWVEDRQDRDARLAISDNYVGVNLSIILGPDDTIEKDVNMFLDNIYLELIETDEYPEGKWIRYVFKKGGAALHVMAQYAAAKSCKVVESGKFKPIMKRVCE